eukprot:2281985-Pleurochrysis_carterae.AAC.4
MQQLELTHAQCRRAQHEVRGGDTVHQRCLRRGDMTFGGVVDTHRIGLAAVARASASAPRCAGGIAHETS